MNVHINYYLGKKIVILVLDSERRAEGMYVLI